ncbi:uncharacterized protein LOC116166562 [Photinus pyralis]|uniref:uncharacterized protein LOC116166562 n=1 Tax=Photinus pyralis TaxID=7054 RepID=UPI0012675901|nr:uncharacterized protein LOC116166562 [Photinus pyralis]
MAEALNIGEEFKEYFNGYVKYAERKSAIGASLGRAPEQVEAGGKPRDVHNPKACSRYLQSQLISYKYQATGVQTVASRSHRIDISPAQHCLHSLTLAFRQRLSFSVLGISGQRPKIQVLEMEAERRKKRKGGAEREREKKKRLLEKTVKTCQNISTLFLGKSEKSKETFERQLDTSTFLVQDTVHQADSDNQTNTENNDSDSIQKKLGDRTNELNNYVEENQTQAIDAETGSHQDESESEPNDDFYFSRPSITNLNVFVEFHPKQPKIANKRYNFELIYFKKSGMVRNWISIRLDKSYDKIYCWICLAFCKEKQLPSLASGADMSLMSVKHLYTRIEEHELSKGHISSTEAYLMHKKEKNVYSLIFSNAAEKHKAQIERNRQILHRIIEAIKVIGKRGLSYRGSDNEAAYSLLDDSIDHGNFLEMILLISKLDVLLRNHIEKVAKESKAIHSQPGRTRGRGNMVTFLSKTTIK